MKKVNETDFEYRGGGISGAKYLFRGPTIDWGILLLKPGEKVPPHYHEEVEETFYVISGLGKIIINNEDYPLKKGDAYYLEPKESHLLENTGTDDLKVLFIKHQYKPDDKVSC
ncbi:MAG: cupin domain-containing protein [archaeon]|nr:cupin domain-containing protein [archaeon]